MHPNLPPSSLVIPAIIFLLSHQFPNFVCSDEFHYSNCNSPVECGGLGKIEYPFWVNGAQPDYCGHPRFKLDCLRGDFPTIQIMHRDYLVMDIDYDTQILKMATFYEFFCPEFDITMDSTLFSYTSDVEIATVFYDCSSTDPHPGSYNFSCVINSFPSHAYLVTNTSAASEFASECKFSASVPVVVPKSADGVKEILSSVFKVNWTVNKTECDECVGSGGRCGYNSTLDQPCCFCPDNPYRNKCPNLRSKEPKHLKKVIIGVCAGLGTLLISSIFFLMYLRRYKKRYPPPFLPRIISSDPSSKTNFESQGSLHGVHIFTYEELEEATNNFDSSKELGDGGFGTVYHGKLRDGRVVAVKRLYENNYKRVEQFMNEVEILQLLRHRNLVSLYGCTSRHSRELLLVYEYVPNGTVADHLHGEQAKPGSLTWPTRMKIAIETASALKYLHASDIIHRDVKTNNILLDNNFSVKVADFGLSRLFPTDVTHVSTAPQGTPGYVDPDYHQCYQLTSKSDVYSFGVVLIELISSMPAVDITRHRHEINLSNMAINKIQNHALHELVDCSLGFDSDQNIRRMIMAVAELAFQCLQNEKEMRPAMDEVLEVLMGIESEGCNIVKTEEVEIPADSGQS
ncbi:LEAF RUST 10 DISEASE-RESISTANCE LOCUS RECEPTOR-LIKE PROTEIN KINASE-like 1.2 [Vitis riparia]|uniref:LEAF RUST 10 DISEASE-RESISTANCE LOCUS RECEPTOR-LIKE PROTEIN KINASE-like 1.2 n=1 Tax=Vitis riparia TaxID=96939 RepID=UPI00155B0A58|nr:LEAF RUST 10 DISEASE-RESISTANCE LOCUS RECEPTOR-LIKE PROTEIN KINASE-like 1.2 [Vitis riparia]